MYLWRTLICLAVFLSTALAAISGTLDERKYHLRSTEQPEWEEFAKQTPHGRRLDIRFQSEPNETEQTLIIRQYDVKLDWIVELNGKKLGKLHLMEHPLTFPIAVAPGTLRKGENVLSILPPKENDDIVVGEFTLEDKPFSATVEVTLTDVDSGAALPARITIADSQGALSALKVLTDSATVAGRPGVVYTANGKAKIAVRPGEYTVYASRGPEYSLAATNVRVTTRQRIALPLRIRREVPTPGLVSCDTHVHTFSFAKHGDATIEERMLTLAGEAVELPISTEHNMLVAFTGAAQKTGTEKYFTPVLGCEVTTRSGHFNAFPIQPNSRVPDFRIENWPALMQNIRSTPGVQMVVLNHPRDVHVGFCPFAATNFNETTGENRRGFDFGFDGVELVNSGALRSDLMEVFRDWFALLNHGYRVVGVGASDSHDVSRFIVAQGRTYIEANDENPGAINVTNTLDNLRRGKALVSLGLITKIKVAEKFGPGDLATNLPPEIRVRVTVLGPSWAEADRVELYANGVPVHRKSLVDTLGRVEKANVEWTLPRPRHDYHLIAIASGPGIKSPHWAIPKPYQPNSPAWKSRILGATNPIWIDADGDGQFSSARAYAAALTQKFAGDELKKAAADYDPAVAAQVAGLQEKK